MRNPSYNRLFVDSLQKDNTSVPHLLERIEHRLRLSTYFRYEDEPDRLYPFATPLLLEEEVRRSLSKAAFQVQDALQDLGERIKKGWTPLPGLHAYTPSITGDRFCFDHGYASLVPVFRVDMALTPQGVKLLEVNTGCPGGELDGGITGSLFQEEDGFLSLARQFDGKKKNLYPSFVFTDPREESMQILLFKYGEFRERSAYHFPQKPTIGIVTSRAQRRVLHPEARGIAEFYRTRGLNAHAGDLGDLRLKADRLYLGQEKIDVLFRKFSTISFFKRMKNEKKYPHLKEVYDAYCNHSYCMVNPLSSTLLQDKALLAALRRDYPDLKDLIPETYILHPHHLERDSNLTKRIFGGEEFIVKKRISFAGKGVIMDPEEIRSKVADIVSKEPGQWIAQKRVEMDKKDFMYIHNGRIGAGLMSYNVACFGESFFVRVSAQGPYQPINAGRNGMAAGLFGVSWEPASGRRSES